MGLDPVPASAFVAWRRHTRRAVVKLRLLFPPGRLSASETQAGIPKGRSVLGEDIPSSPSLAPPPNNGDPAN